MKLKKAITMGFILGVALQSVAATPGAKPQTKKNPIPKQIPGGSFRAVNGVTNIIWSRGWLAFQGKVLQTTHNGVLVKGILCEKAHSGPTFEGTFFVRNFPFDVADESYIGDEPTALYAKEDGFFSYLSILGSESKVRALDFGKPCNPPTIQKIKSPGDGKK